MAVVTISREFGSEGNSISAKVAEALGYRMIFKKEISEVFEQYGMASFENIYQADVNFWTQFDAMRMRMMEFLTKVIQAFAHYGNVVIVGRCSYAILAEFTDVLHVRIQAPLSLRIDRIMQEGLAVPGEVEDLVKNEDQKRVRLLHTFYNMPWNQVDMFDLVVNTGKVVPDLAVTWIVEAVKRLEKRSPSKDPTTKTIEVGPLLEDVVTSALIASEQAAS